MKLQFKRQKFQAEAAVAVCAIFKGTPPSGQRWHSASYLIDRDLVRDGRNELEYDETSFVVRNHAIELSEETILSNLRSVQKIQGIKPDENLAKYDVEMEDPVAEKKIHKTIPYNFTVEMETGVGKTYTYIKTMYELNARYGWGKFIVIVPSVAVREGVYKSFEITADHFLFDYGKRIRFFIYNSSRLDEIDHFAQGTEIKAMIINSQAFNARGKDARRIYMRLDSFNSRRPIDIIARTNPIVIIDEPQSVEGRQTKNSIGWFNPLFILRYSATPKEKYNMAYRLDAMEAYNKKLVKKISVKGVTQSGATATAGYLYLQNIALSKDDPAAYLEFERKTRDGVKKTTRKIYERDKFNLYDQSGGMEEYRNGYIVTRIDGRDNSLSFLNGISIKAGEVQGEVNEVQLRRIQIRETIISHLDRERRLYSKGIKVLSLFFIDEVAKYRKYNEAGDPYNGEYADIFEEEYQFLLHEGRREPRFGVYYDYLDGISAAETHAGYFSIDKDKKNGKERFRDSSLERGGGEAGEKEKDAFDLIMRDKERLLDIKEPVRFIFSHSALREGWDNTNVFQICALKKSGSDTRKRQEIGRGLRLCVNQNGERMDESALNADVHAVNVLTVIANESYEDFTGKLQSELAEALEDRPAEVAEKLFTGGIIYDDQGNEREIDERLAKAIYRSFLKNDYIDDAGQLTPAYYDAKETNALKLPEEIAGSAQDICAIVDSVYNPNALLPDNERNKNLEAAINEEQFARKEFRELWERINAKSVYTAQFDTDELIKNAINEINKELSAPQVYFAISAGSLETIPSKQALQKGAAFTRNSGGHEKALVRPDNSVKYDLVGKITAETGLTRQDIVSILKGIAGEKFAMFAKNPEEFIIKTSRIINEQKAAAIIQYIEYTLLDDAYDTSIFTEPSLKGRLNENAIPLSKHIYDYLLYDSKTECKFAVELDKDEAVTVYVKLPKSFFINTPVGSYTPDWAIAFKEGTVKHIYFVAETKGSMSTLELRKIEEARISCARKHFEKIGASLVMFDKVDSYKTLLDKVLKG
jgi:type III restriction enzyme